jgi:hypothetical protein
VSALTAENLKGTRHGLPPAREVTHPRPGGSHVARYPDIPPGTVPGRVLGVPACAGGGGAASADGPVPLVAAGESAARQSSADVSACRAHRSTRSTRSTRDGPLRRTGDRSGVLLFGSHSRGTLYQYSVPDVGVLGVLTRGELRLDSHGSTRDGTVSGNPSVLA